MKNEYKKLPELIYKKITFTKKCYLWNAYISANGYGQYSYKKKSYKAHRLIWELLKGKIPQGIEVDHLCRNRKCVNIAHLELVTKRENILRGESFAAVNARKATCKNGHVFNRTYLRNGGRWRLCDICSREKSRKWKAQFRDATKEEKR